MLAHQQREVRVARLFVLGLEAVPVDRDYAVGVLVDHNAVRIHAERAHIVLAFLGLINDFALVKLARKVLENLGVELHSHAEVHAIGARGNVQLAAERLHPLAAAPSHGNYTVAAGISLFRRNDFIPVFRLFYGDDGRMKIKVRFVFKLGVKVAQHLVIDVRAEMAHLGIKKIEFVLHADLVKLRTRGRKQPRFLSAVRHVDRIYVFHKFQRAFFADMLPKVAAEVVGNVVLAVRKRPGSSEPGHYRAGLAVYAAFYLHSVDGTPALGKRAARLENRSFQSAVAKFERGENSARSGSHDYYVVIHNDSPF